MKQLHIRTFGSHEMEITLAKASVSIVPHQLPRPASLPSPTVTTQKTLLLLLVPWSVRTITVGPKSTIPISFPAVENKDMGIGIDGGSAQTRCCGCGGLSGDLKHCRR